MFSPISTRAPHPNQPLLLIFFTSLSFFAAGGQTRRRCFLTITSFRFQFHDTTDDDDTHNTHAQTPTYTDPIHPPQTFREEGGAHVNQEEECPPYAQPSTPTSIRKHCVRSLRTYIYRLAHTLQHRRSVEAASLISDESTPPPHRPRPFVKPDPRQNANNPKHNK